MNIELSKTELEILAELVFIGELVVNGERGKKKIGKYLRAKNRIINAYRSTLNSEEQEYFAVEQNEFDHYFNIIREHLIVNEAAYLIYTLSGKFGELMKDYDDASKITKWRGDSRLLLQRLC